MTPTTTATAADTILAIDLGKYKCVARLSQENQIGVAVVGNSLTGRRITADTSAQS